MNVKVIEAKRVLRKVKSDIAVSAIRAKNQIGRKVYGCKSVVNAVRASF